MTLVGDKPSAAAVLISFFTGSWGAITFQEWLAIFGFIATGVSIGISWYYNHKRYKLAQKGDSDK